MTTIETQPVRYDPYDVAINRDPYPVFRRLREEAPLYYNDEYDFYAVSRHVDVERGLKDNTSFISSRGAILEFIKADVVMPPGTVIFEDPPTHTVHRKLMSRMFTPRKVAELEDEIRVFCAEALDRCVGTGHFDFVRDLGSYMPMRTIGMLLGVPAEDQERIREIVDGNLRAEEGKAMEVGDTLEMSSELFADYIDWREQHPSDDIMTELLNVEFEDETGAVRRLRREELLTYISVISGAGNETTTRLIGWTGKVLADHPDQRRELVEDRSLVPNAIEEILRYESPAPYIGRYVAREAEFHGTTVPEGAALLLLGGSANRDDAKFPDGDRFDIHRNTAGLLTFGYGIHFCLGAALARLEGRIALDEILQRFPEWEIDTGNARLAPTTTVRGWDTLPAVVPSR
jgi:cytochrome P450